MYKLIITNTSYIFVWINSLRAADKKIKTLKQAFSHETEQYIYLKLKYYAYTSFDDRISTGLTWVYNKKIYANTLGIIE